VCAALWRARARSPEPGVWKPVAAAFCAAVLLHTMWDLTGFGAVRIAVAGVSFALLGAQLRGLRRGRAHRSLTNLPQREAA
jgi:hypothetical protein